MASAPTIDPRNYSIRAESTQTDSARSEPSKNNPLRKTVGDMTRSLAVVGVVIAALLLVTWRPQPDPVRTVDPFPIASLAVREAAFIVLMPRLSDEWRSTSARLEPTTQSAGKSVWFNGWVSPNDEFFAVSQSHATHNAFIDEQTNFGAPVDLKRELADDSSWPWVESTGSKRKWVTHLSPDGLTKSLVRIKNDHATVVSTTASWSQLDAFAERLVRARKEVASRP